MPLGTPRRVARESAVATCARTESNRVVRYVRPLDPNAFKPAQFHSLRLADASTGLESCICIVTRVPPGTGTTSGLHVHPVNQVYYVLEGAMRMQLGTDTFTVRPGQMVVIPKGTPHWNWNDDDADELHF